MITEINDTTYFSYLAICKQAKELKESATIESKEAYLLWVNSWKMSIKNLEKAIRQAKIDKDRSFVFKMRPIASSLYEIRVEMKQKSWLAKQASL